MNSTAENYDSTANEDDGSCIIYGCTIDLYPNFNPVATVDDFSCDMNSLNIYGCTSDEYVEYDPNANIDNGTCLTSIWEGCLDPNACNYNPNAIIEGDCEYYSIYSQVFQNGIPLFDENGIPIMEWIEYPEVDCSSMYIFGCTDSLALNYDPNATFDDGSCDYVGGVGVEELEVVTPQLIKMIDILGREQKEHKRGALYSTSMITVWLRRGFYTKSIGSF